MPKLQVKLELFETLLSRLFYESSHIFTHLNFVTKRKDKKKLFFTEIEDCGQGGVEILEVRCCVPLDSLCEGKPEYYPDQRFIGFVFVPYSPVCCYIFWH